MTKFTTVFTTNLVRKKLIEGPDFALGMKLLIKQVAVNVGHLFVFETRQLTADTARTWKDTTDTVSVKKF